MAKGASSAEACNQRTSAALLVLHRFPRLFPEIFPGKCQWALLHVSI